jgi:AcrR family transcriptional regulator
VLDDTKQRILDCGKAEFLKNGYKNASLRSIAKAAGVTTGAIYGYFPDKSTLFDALVSKPAGLLLDRYLKVHTEFAKLSAAEQVSEMNNIGQSHMPWMVELIYGHFDVFKLIVCCSDGTEYSGYVDRLVEVEVESTYQFINTLQDAGYKIHSVDDDLMHLLANAFFSGLFEVVAHDMLKEKAEGYITRLHEFYTAGWNRILGMG